MQEKDVSYLIKHNSCEIKDALKSIDFEKMHQILRPEITKVNGIIAEVINSDTFKVALYESINNIDFSEIIRTAEEFSAKVTEEKIILDKKVVDKRKWAKEDIIKFAKWLIVVLATIGITLNIEFDVEEINVIHLEEDNNYYYVNYGD